MFTKEEIKARLFELNRKSRESGLPEHEADIGLADVILSLSLFGKKLRDGSPYITHPNHLAFKGSTRSEAKQIIALLHDVIEDSDWSVEDLREVGFSERICRAVDGLSKRDGENYFEFIVRCGLSGEDAIDIKMEDLEHNSTHTRAPYIYQTDRSKLKDHAYNISYFYLLDIKKGKIEPGTPIIGWLATHPSYSPYPDLVNNVLDEFSDLNEYLPEPVRFDFGTTLSP
jgi:hypothetical protein